jgi:hypothetical protein
MNDLETARDLRATATYLREHGWLQFALGVDGGPRCVFGGFESVTGDDYRRQCAMADALIGLPLVVNWNNAPGRTLDEVLDRLESTALALEVRALAAENVSANPELPVAAETRDYAKVAS